MQRENFTLISGEIVKKEFLIGQRFFMEETKEIDGR